MLFCLEHLLLVNNLELLLLIVVINGLELLLNLCSVAVDPGSLLLHVEVIVGLDGQSVLGLPLLLPSISREEIVSSDLILRDDENIVLSLLVALSHEGCLGIFRALNLVGLLQKWGRVRVVSHREEVVR